MRRPDLILTMITAAGLLGGSGIAVAAQGPTSDNDPASLTPASTTVFAPAFEYMIPDAMSASERFEESVVFALGPKGRGERENDPRPFGPVQSEASTTGARGIVVANVTETEAHPCPDRAGPGRVPIGGDAAAFLDDLRAIAGLRLEDDGATTLGGRPARAVIASLGTDCGYVGDIHVSSVPWDWVTLGIPSWIIVAEVDGSTVMAQVWAGTPEDLEAWLPVAQEFLDSIHFVDPVDS